MPLLIRGPQSSPAPSEYTLAQNQAFVPESVTATFVGTAAAFLPTLSIYAQSGELLARCPAPEVAAGDTAEVTFAPLLRAVQAAAAGATMSIASLNAFTTTDVSSGASTKVGFQADGFLLTNDPTTFTLDQDSVAPNPYGLGIHADGFYLLGFTVTMHDKAGFRIANPETVVVEAGDSANGATYIESGLLLGEQDVTGVHPNFAPTISQWAPHWWVTVAVHGSTGTRPVVTNVLQSSGQTLMAEYPSVVALRLSTSTLGL